jgi:hypothetical protein
MAGAHGLELKWNSVAALYERRQGVEDLTVRFGGHRPPLQARLLAAKRESQTADSIAQKP